MPLKGGGDVKVTSLMKDDSAYFAVSPFLYMPSWLHILRCLVHNRATAGLCQLKVHSHDTTYICQPQRGTACGPAHWRLHPQVELPRVSPLVKGRPYKYAYACTARLPTTAVNALSKFDLEAGTCKTWFEPGTIPTGAACVPLMRHLRSA